MIVETRLVAGNSEIPLTSVETSGASEQRHALAGSKFLRHAIAARSIVFTESFLAHGNGRQSTREVKFSTSGLSEALDQLLADCAQLMLR
jgi:hypothetical protein